MSEDRIFVGIAIEWFKMGHNKDEIIENMTQRYSGISKEEMREIVDEAKRVFNVKDMEKYEEDEWDYIENIDEDEDAKDNEGFFICSECDSRNTKVVKDGDGYYGKAGGRKKIYCKDCGNKEPIW